MIPKNIFFYWGNETISLMRYMTVYSFSKLNPDWNIYLIRNSNNQEIKRWDTWEESDKDYYQGEDYSALMYALDITVVNRSFNSTNDLHMANVHIKDIANWCILSTSGGLVADMDILFIKPIAYAYEQLNFMNADIALTCFSGLPKKNYIPVTFMGGSSNNRFYKEIYENAKRSYNPEIYECCGENCIGYSSLEEIQLAFPDLRVVRLPDEIIYPFVTKYKYNTAVKLIHKHNAIDEIPPDCIGVHWYGASPFAKELNMKITAYNYKKTNTTITKLIERVIDHAEVSTTK